MVKNNNNNNNNVQQLDEKPIANGHALQNGNGSTVGVAAPPTAVDVSWRQYLWNSWDAFADVMWFIICSIGFILQVRFQARFVVDLCELMSLWSCSMSCFVCFWSFIYCFYHTKSPRELFYSCQQIQIV